MESNTNIFNNLHLDTCNLNTGTCNSFQFLSIQDTEDLTNKKALYKKLFKNTSEYIEFNAQLKMIRDTKLPFRIVDQLKRLIKQNGKIPSYGEFRINLPAYLLPGISVSKKERKSLIQKFESELITKSCGLEKPLSIAEKTLWLHGSNSSIFALLPYIEYQMIPTGRLLDCGFAPMSGEIALGGMTPKGVNQRALSTDTIRGFERCWDYATNISKSFNASEYELNEESLFLKNIDFLKSLTSHDDVWDPTIVSLMRLKQWQPDRFEELTKKYINEIAVLKKTCIGRQASSENLILKALDYNVEELQKAKTPEEIKKEVGAIEATFPGVFEAFNRKWYVESRANRIGRLFLNPCWFDSINENLNAIVFNILLARAFGDEELALIKAYAAADKFNLNTHYEIQKELGEDFTAEIFVNHFVRKKIQESILPSQRRYERLLSLFDVLPKIRFTERERSLIKNPFPVLLSSTQTKSYGKSDQTEFHLSEATLGKEIDQLFVNIDDMPAMIQWLKDHLLENCVSVKDVTLLKQLKNFPLNHSESQVT